MAKRLFKVVLESTKVGAGDWSAEAPVNVVAVMAQSAVDEAIRYQLALDREVRKDERADVKKGNLDKSALTGEFAYRLLSVEPIEPVDVIVKAEA